MIIKSDERVEQAELLSTREGVENGWEILSISQRLDMGKGQIKVI